MSLKNYLSGSEKLKPEKEASLASVPQLTTFFNNATKPSKVDSLQPDASDATCHTDKNEDEESQTTSHSKSTGLDGSLPSQIDDKMCETNNGCYIN